MADLNPGSSIEDELRKEIDRIAAQERLPTLQSDLFLLAVISILLGYFILEQQRYWSRFPKDHTRFKILAAWLAFLEAMFFAIRFSATWITTTNAVLGGSGERPGFLSIWSIVVTTLIEATVEGFFVWRLWTVTKKWWMRYISIFLWAFSFIAHCVWVGKAGVAGRSNLVDDAEQLVVVIIAFWGTFAEGSFVATCLLYELKFAHDRQVIKRLRKSSAVGQLVSLAMRTSGILVVFELIVAIAVTVRSQPPRALLIEVEFSAGIYTVLAAIIVLFTLNWRATIRAPEDGGIGGGGGGGGGGVVGGGRAGRAGRGPPRPRRAQDDNKEEEEDQARGGVATPTFLRSKSEGSGRSGRGGGGGGGTGGPTAMTTYGPEEGFESSPKEEEDDQAEAERGEKGEDGKRKRGAGVHGEAVVVGEGGRVWVERPPAAHTGGDDADQYEVSRDRPP